MGTTIGPKRADRQRPRSSSSARRAVRLAGRPPSKEFRGQIPSCLYAWPVSPGAEQTERLSVDHPLEPIAMALNTGEFEVDRGRGRVLAVNVVGAADGYP